MDSFPDGIAVSSETRKQVMIYLLGGVIVALIVLFSIPMLLNGAESSNGFLPHAFCYLKTQPLIWLHVISDSLIGLAYTAIPAALFYFVKMRRDLPFNWMFLAFGVFIIACGWTHFMEVWTVWTPAYWLSGAVKALTALASVPTAVALVLLIPKALHLPSPSELAKAKRELEAEVRERRQAEARLKEAHDELETRVQSRTADLQNAVEDLAREIGERQRVEEALSASEQRYRTLFEDCPYPMWVYDAETLQFLKVNEACVSQYGYSRAEFLKMNIEQMRPQEDLPILRQYLSTLQPGKENRVVWRHSKKDGDMIQVEVSSDEITFDGKRARLVIINDVTERHRLEEQLRHSQKMEAVGRLAGGIAHDFNNLLTAIIGYADLLQLQTGNDEQISNNIEQIRKAGRRAASLTSQLLIFSRRQVVQPKLLNLDEIIADMAKMLQRLLSENIEFKTITKAGFHTVKADLGQLEQVILNLVINAGDAMPVGGQLTLEISNAYLDENYPRRNRESQPGEFVLLTVTDTGIGMEQSMLEKIFEPFFTTKEVGKGTGLGLSTVYSIVQQSGGHIEVESEVGKGTSFRVYLPVAVEPRQHHEESAEGDWQQGNETILLVEDDEAVRRLAKTILMNSGYRVLEAASGAAALEIIKAHPGKIHLTLTDVVMPHMSGRELYEQIARLRPQTKVLYMSGYTDDDMVHHGVEKGEQRFLQKPFSPLELAHKVREALEN